MADQKQVRKIKCPYCGWIRSISVDASVDERMTGVAAGPGDVLREIGSKIRAALHDSQLDEANAWIKLPKCPHCGHEYLYNVNTHEVEK